MIGIQINIVFVTSIVSHFLINLKLKYFNIVNEIMKYLEESYD